MPVFRPPSTSNPALGASLRVEGDRDLDRRIAGFDRRRERAGCPETGGRRRDLAELGCVDWTAGTYMAKTYCGKLAVGFGTSKENTCEAQT